MDRIQYDDPYAFLRQSLEAKTSITPDLAGRTSRTVKQEALQFELPKDLVPDGAEPNALADGDDVVEALTGEALDGKDGEVFDLGSAGTSFELGGVLRDPLAKFPGGIPRPGDMVNMLAEQGRGAKGDRTSQASYGVVEFLDDAAVVVGAVATVVGAVAGATVAASGAAVAGAGAAAYGTTRWLDEKTGAGDAVVDLLVEKANEGEEPGPAAGPDPIDEEGEAGEAGEAGPTDEEGVDTEKTEGSEDTDPEAPDETQPLPDGIREDIQFDAAAFARWKEQTEGGLVQPGPDGFRDLPDRDSLDTFDPYAGPKQDGVIDWGPDGPPSFGSGEALPEVIGVDDPPEGFGLGAPADEAR